VRRPLASGKRTVRRDFRVHRWFATSWRTGRSRSLQKCTDARTTRRSSLQKCATVEGPPPCRPLSVTP
jgi:hypothetical protein